MKRTDEMQKFFSRENHSSNTLDDIDKNNLFKANSNRIPLIFYPSKTARWGYALLGIETLEARGARHPSYFHF